MSGNTERETGRGSQVLVLIVDDESDIRSVVRASMEREGFSVIEAGSRAEAMSALRAHAVDLAIIDLDLPDSTGFELLAALRAEQRDLLVMILTGASSEASRVLGLMSGADDYVTKPFSPREVAARAIALSRRRQPEPTTSTELTFGDLSINPFTRHVRRDGRAIDMPPRELDLLIFLATNAGRAFTREELLHGVWSASSAWLGVATVTEHVRRLRTRIERDPLHPERIVTVRGSGYRFETDVASEPAEPASESGASETLDAVVVIVGTTLVYVSPTTVELLRATSEDDLLGHDVFDFVAEESVAATVRRHESAKAGRWPRPELITLRCVDGSRVLVELASGPVLWKGQAASQVTMWSTEDAQHRT